MYVNEFGKRLILDVGYDVSSNSGDDGLRIEVIQPDGTEVTYNKASGSPVAYGTIDSTVTDEAGKEFTLTANEYIYRDWADGDLAQSGTYRVRAIYEDADKQLVSKQTAFHVMG
jgi:hypothetical protein